MIRNDMMISQDVISYIVTLMKADGTTQRFKVCPNCLNNIRNITSTRIVAFTKVISSKPIYIKDDYITCEFCAISAESYNFLRHFGIKGVIARERKESVNWYSFNK